jgi:hypothetical protein
MRGNLTQVPACSGKASWWKSLTEEHARVAQAVRPAAHERAS